MAAVELDAQFLIDVIDAADAAVAPMTAAQWVELGLLRSTEGGVAVRVGLVGLDPLLCVKAQQVVEGSPVRASGVDDAPSSFQAINATIDTVLMQKDLGPGR